jgi:hypothetical protein
MPRALRHAFEWAWAYFTNQRGARLITGDIDKRSPDTAAQ